MRFVKILRISTTREKSDPNPGAITDKVKIAEEYTNKTENLPLSYLFELYNDFYESIISHVILQ